jgi:Holliday junction resolvase RusA-like endonuclease
MYTRSIEMPIMRYAVPGTPTPLQRPRFNSGHRPYDAQKNQKHEFKFHVETQHGNLPFYTTPVMLFAYFFFMIPKTSATRTEQLLHTPHTFRPDTSNLIKYVEDCAQGILYRDDSIIYYAYGVKIWSTEPRTEFFIIPKDQAEKVFPDAYYLQYQLPQQS